MREGDRDRERCKLSERYVHACAERGQLRGLVRKVSGLRSLIIIATLPQQQLLLLLLLTVCVAVCACV